MPSSRSPILTSTRIKSLWCDARKSTWSSAATNTKTGICGEDRTSSHSSTPTPTSDPSQSSRSRSDSLERGLRFPQGFSWSTTELHEIPASSHESAAGRLGFRGVQTWRFSPDRIVATTTELLDGTEITVRNRPGRLTDLILAGFVREAGPADLALLNSGAIRIDDTLPPARDEYDAIRVLPFGGIVLKASLDGSLVASVLEIGMKNQGTGGYLQTWGVSRSGNQWLVQGRPLDPTRRYTVILPDFLLTGRETNLPFLTRANPAVHDVQEFRDLRKGLIEELRATYSGAPQ